jgi:hypothetical protein
MANKVNCFLVGTVILTLASGCVSQKVYTYEARQFSANSTNPPVTVTASGPLVGSPGGSPGSCPAPYCQQARVTNDANGSIWFTPQSGATTGTLTDVTQPPVSGYTSDVQVLNRFTGARWCGTTTVTFPASSSYQYGFFIYALSPACPPSGTVLHAVGTFK